VVPAVVQEGDAVVDGAADDLDAFGLVLLPADVVAAQPDNGHLLPGAPELAIAHPPADRVRSLPGFRPGATEAGRCHGSPRRSRPLQKLSTLHLHSSSPAQGRTH